LVWNLEDPLEEVERRIAAILIHYEIAPEEISGRLFVNSGRDTPLVIAERQRDATIVLVAIVDGLKAEIKDLSIDTLIVDPFVSCHRIPENDNPAIDLVVKTWGEIAGSANIAVELAHHVRKPSNASAGGDFDVYDARGAASFTQAARSVRVLNTMSQEDAEKAKISEIDRRAYFRVDRDAKANMKPATQKADWRRFVSVCLDNATEEDPADWIGVVTAWKMPGTFDGVEVWHLREVQKAIAGGEWRADPRSPNWVGRRSPRFSTST
jgi:RecA-family ATPase